MGGEEREVSAVRGHGVHHTRHAPATQPRKPNAAAAEVSLQTVRASAGVHALHWTQKSAAFAAAAPPVARKSTPRKPVRDAPLRPSAIRGSVGRGEEAHLARTARRQSWT